MREPKTAQKLASRLVHDVAKYISRAARNMSGNEDADGLIEMLTDDLYRLDGLRRASTVFEETAEILEAEIGTNTHLVRCRERLSRIDALEPSVRAKKAAAIRDAVQSALAVEAELRALSAALDSGEIS